MTESTSWRRVMVCADLKRTQVTSCRRRVFSRRLQRLLQIEISLSLFAALE